VRWILHITLATSLIVPLLAGCSVSHRPGAGDGIHDIAWTPRFEACQWDRGIVALGGVVPRQGSVLDIIPRHHHVRLEAPERERIERWCALLRSSLGWGLPEVVFMHWSSVSAMTPSDNLDNLLSHVSIGRDLEPALVLAWGRHLGAPAHLMLARAEDTWSYGQSTRTVVATLDLYDLSVGELIWTCTVEQTVEWEPMPEPAPTHPPATREPDVWRTSDLTTQHEGRRYCVRRCLPPPQAPEPGIPPVPSPPEPRPPYPPSVDAALLVAFDWMTEILAGMEEDLTALAGGARVLSRQPRPSPPG